MTNSHSRYHYEDEHSDSSEEDFCNASQTSSTKQGKSDFFIKDTDFQRQVNQEYGAKKFIKP